MAFVQFTVNGRKCIVDLNIPLETSLNIYLRYHLGLTGTKAMCRQGGCGACIVSVRARRYPSGHVETFSVNSCLVLVFSCQGWEITTVEGIGNRHDGYHEIQKRMAAFNATQCGYCTPGWVMQLYSLQDQNLTMDKLEKSFGGNTCRCTGYRPILDTIKSFAVDASPQLCQRVQDIEDTVSCDKANCQRKCSIASTNSDWSVLEDLKYVTTNRKLVYQLEAPLFYKVYDENDIFDILFEEGDDSYMLIDGNTAKGLLESFEYPRLLIDISNVRTLKQYGFDQNLVLGANISLQDCIKIFNDSAQSRIEFAYLKEFAEHFELIAHVAVRNIGSLAGNLMAKRAMPSYQSDVFVLFSCVGAMITVRDANGKKDLVTMADFLSYEMHGKLMVNIELPPLSTSDVFKSYKIMPRNLNALAIVNAAFLLKINKDTKLIEKVSVVYGNITPEFVHATETEEFLKGKNIFTNTNLQFAIKTLCSEVNPNNEPPKQSPECRKKLAIGLFYKFILSISTAGALSSRYSSGGIIFTRPVSKGYQDFQTDPSLYPLNKPTQKYEAIIQSSGEARYSNDMPILTKQVFGAFILSTVHVGEIDEIDTETVLEMEGVVAVFTAKDIPGKNSFIYPGIRPYNLEDEEILTEKEIKFYGQPVGIVVAESEELAAKASRKVKVMYKNISSAAPVITIDQAKKDSKRLKPSDKSIKPMGKGNDVEKVIKGVIDLPGQYHYYTEPLTCVAIPSDYNLLVYAATQWIDLTQVAIAQSLNIKQSDITVIVRRVGGGFGGKLSRSAQVSSACALVAKKLDRPCRFILPMDTNMMAIGKRPPTQCEYEVGVNSQGKIQYLDATILENVGCSNDENLLKSKVENGFVNCYKKDYFNVKSASVLTDTSSNTFARAPGTFEGITCIEHIMEHIASAIQKDPTEVRISNMVEEENDLPKLIEELKKDADYDSRLKEIKQFNQENRWMKKAIKLSVMLFPIEYTGNHNALISIYRDGTVTINCGGVEVGQGINTKAAQVCAYEFGIPLEDVSVLPHYTFTSPNSNSTSNSLSSECVCYAITKACGILKDRLEPIKQKMNNPSWKELIAKAASNEEEVDLCAEYMMTEKEIDLQKYTVFAVAILEVQLDVLTGKFDILRADILEDVGLSANPNIDVGQVEGAYVQSLGYFTTEKLIFDEKTGKLLTNRSLNYHVPLALDIPIDFRVKLRYNSKNPKGVLGSKAVGEMGTCTTQGITHALRHCIMESRKESGYDYTEWINIDFPYDQESILKALDVKFEEMVFA